MKLSDITYDDAKGKALPTQDGDAAHCTSLTVFSLWKLATLRTLGEDTEVIVEQNKIIIIK